MPIRTNRGRAVVYRRVWGWPLRSGRNLLAVTLTLLAIGAGIGLLGGLVTGGPPPERDAGVHPAFDGSDVTAPTSDASHDANRSPSPSPSASPVRDERLDEVIVTARLFATNWVTHPEGTTASEWRASLKPYATSELLTKVRTVDPANVPATKVTGPPIVVDDDYDTVVVDVRTNELVLRLTLADAADGWRVADYSRADA